MVLEKNDLEVVRRKLLFFFKENHFLFVLPFDGLIIKVSGSQS